jgi:iron complex outermembrane receptor protein
MSRITPLVILAAFFSIPFKSQAQPGGKSRNPENSGTVTGRITFLDSMPIELVPVSLVELNKQTLTNSDGVYLIEGVAPGRYTLRIQMFDTKQIDLPVEVSAGQNSVQD